MMSKLHNILFKTWCVEAILQGAKTQTRRILKGTEGPKYKVGDTLRVREAWQVIGWNEDVATLWIQNPVDGAQRWVNVPEDKSDAFEKLWEETSRDAIAADVPHDGFGEYDWSQVTIPGRKRSGMLMYNFVARLFLTVTEVRTERIQDISQADALAEGVEFLPPKVTRDLPTGCDAVTRLAAAWDSINGKPKRHNTPAGGYYTAYPWGWEAFCLGCSDKVRLWSGAPLRVADRFNLDGEEEPRNVSYRDESLYVTPNPRVAAYTFKIGKGEGQ